MVPTWDLDFFNSLTRDHMVNPDRDSSQFSIADMLPEVTNWSLHQTDVEASIPRQPGISRFGQREQQIQLLNGVPSTAKVRG